MDILVFLTDRFPYGKGEAFIENEIPLLAQRFDKVIVIPTALTVNIEIKRELPNNFIVLFPANTDDLYKNGRPDIKKRITWAVKYMFPWCVRTLFTKELYSETIKLLKNHQLNVERFMQIVRVLAPTKRNVMHFKKQCKELEINKSDNVYLYSYWMNSNIIYANEIIGINDACIQRKVMRAHRHDLYSEKRACGYIPFQRDILQYVDILSLISKDGMDYISTKYPRYQKKYKLSYLGTKDYGVSPYNENEVFHVVTCSYVIPVKRVHRIVESLEMINERIILWTHFGTGQDFENLKKLAEKKLGNKSNIRYEFKGHVMNEELMKYYQHNQVSLFINVSESEGLPVSIMEALSFGIPVVATDVGGTAEAIIEGKNGFLLKSDFTNNQLVNAIIAISDLEHEKYLSMRNTARELWKEKFSENTNYNMFIKNNFPRMKKEK